MRDNKSGFNALLIYANHSENNIVFQQELDDMVRSGYPKLKIIHVLDDAGKEWQGERGYVDEARLTKYIKNFKNKAFYICCPAPMRKKVLKILHKMGVKNRQIRAEIFSL